MPNLHTPERLDGESRADYSKRRRASQREVNRMTLRGPSGKADALALLLLSLGNLRTLFSGARA